MWNGIFYGPIGVGFDAASNVAVVIVSYAVLMAADCVVTVSMIETDQPR